MFALSGPTPVTVELVPAREDRPAVRVTFQPQPTPLSLRAARRAVGAIFRDGKPDSVERAGDAFSAALIRHNIISWEGIGDENGDPVEPSPDREILDDNGMVVGVEPGTISAFLAEPRLVEAADRQYIGPWTELDAEKNASSASPNGIGEAGTPAGDTANSPVTPGETADAVTPTPAPRPARTTSTSRKRTKAKPSGR